MDKQKIKGIYEYLEAKRKEFAFARNKSEKERIERSVRNYAEYMDPDIYLYLNENAASGLFRHGFFESDLNNSLNKLQKLLDTNENETIL